VAYTALLSFVAIPIAVAFAILKYRLYEIDPLSTKACFSSVFSVEDQLPGMAVEPRSVVGLGYGCEFRLECPSRTGYVH